MAQSTCGPLVWIEQEIAIATFVQRIEKRKLPVMAFIHKSVGREGIRDLLHLNPISFTDESEVLGEVCKGLLEWKGLDTTDLRVQLQSVSANCQQGHPIRRLEVSLVNDTNQPISKLNVMLRLPAGILKHWSASYAFEVKKEDPRYRYFRLDEPPNGPIPPHDTRLLVSYDYCPKCAITEAGGIADLVAKATVQAKVWIDGHEYSAQKSMEELAQEAEGVGYT